MIGQEKLWKTVFKLLDSGFPRYTIIWGNRHSGKRMVASQIAEKLNAHLIESSLKVDDIRDIIQLAYKQSEPTVYLLAGADKMSPAAKNALLKITEEPPRKAYFIMTLEDINNTLATLKSRGTVLNMDPYSSDELLMYADQRGYELSQVEENIISNICTTPGQVDLLVRYNIEEFYSFAETVIDNIGVVNGANAFKIGQKLHYKEDDEGWDIELFLRAIMFIYLHKMIIKADPKYQKSIAITSKYLSQIGITGVNKSATIDMWILEMRGVWVE